MVGVTIAMETIDEGGMVADRVVVNGASIRPVKQPAALFTGAHAPPSDLRVRRHISWERASILFLILFYAAAVSMTPSARSVSCAATQ